MPLRRGTARWSAFIALALVTSIALAGCSVAPKSGSTAKSVEKSIEEVAGVDHALVAAKTILYSGHGAAAFVSVSLEPGFGIGDPTQALDWLLKSAWSVNDSKVSDGVFVELTAADGKPLAWDWQSAASALDLPVPAQPDSTGYLYFTSAAIAKKYGPWPDKVPTPPATLIVKN